MSDESSGKMTDNLISTGGKVDTQIEVVTELRKILHTGTVEQKLLAAQMLLDYKLM